MSTHRKQAGGEAPLSIYTAPVSVPSQYVNINAHCVSAPRPSRQGGVINSRLLNHLFLRLVLVMVVHPVDRQEMFFHHPVKLFTVTVPLCNISWAKQVFNLNFKPNDILLRSRCLTFPPTGVSVAMQPFKQHTTTQ